jgi:hypothetical protein
MKPERGRKVGSDPRTVRSRDRKLTSPVTLFAAIEADQHEALRAIAFAERRSLADVVRGALDAYLAQHQRGGRLVAGKR